MTADERVTAARAYYLSLAGMWDRHRCTKPCALAEAFGQEFDAASLALGLAVAEASDERSVRSVA